MSAKPATRTTRVTRSRKPDEADALASELDRVLKVGQPKPKPTPATKAAVPAKRVASKPTTTRPTASAPKPTASTSTSTTRPRAVSTTRTEAGRKEARAPRTTASAAPATKGKTKEKEPPAPQYPWCVAGELSPRERSVAAQAAIKDAVRASLEAQKEGFKWDGGKSEAATRVDAAIAKGVAGVQVARELFTGSANCLGVEKGAMNLVIHCLIMDMHKQAMDIMLECKKGILRLYEHEPLPEPKPAPKPSTSRVKPAPPEPDFRRLSAFPLPTSPIADDVREIICTFGLASWACLLALGKVDADNIETHLPLPTETSDLNPISIAPSLPSVLSTTAVLAYRPLRSLNVPTRTSQWLHVRKLLAFLTGVCVSKSHAPPNTADKLWDSVGRSAETYLQERKDDCSRREIATFISWTTGITEKMCNSRGDSRSQWFIGGWSHVVDIWVGIGRTLGDSTIIDEALGAMTAAVALDSSKRSASPESTISSSTSSTGSTPSDGTAVTTPEGSPAPSVFSHVNPARASSELTYVSARLAKSLLAVETLSVASPPDARALQETLSAASVKDILPLLSALGDTETSSSCASTCIRGLERLRRVTIKLLAQPAYLVPAREWLEEVFNLMETAFRSVKSAGVLRAVVRDGLPGIVDSGSNLLRVANLPASSPSAVALIDRAYAIWQNYGEHLDLSPRVQYGVFLIQCVHTVAYRLTKCNALRDAYDLGQRACDWTIAMRPLAGANETVASAQAWQSAVAALPKRFELVAYCAPNDTEKLSACVLGLINLPPPALAKIESAAGKQSLSPIFASIPDAEVLLRRLATVFSAETDEKIEGGMREVLKTAMETREQSKVLRAAILEQVIDTIEPVIFRPQAQEAMLEVCDTLLQIYTAEYPLRRMRVIVRLMGVIVACGVTPDRFDALADEVASLASAELGKDVQLAQFKFEYQSSALILACLNKYHTELEPSTVVAQLGREALGVIRAAVFPVKEPAGRRSALSTRTQASRTTVATRTPSTRSTKAATKPVASKRTVSKPEVTAEPPVAIAGDDTGRFTQLLSSLASLFGLLGHVLPRLETLELLRAVLRASEGMSDSLTHTSGLLAVEYSRLGKFSRAAKVFAQALKVAADAKVSAGTMADVHLRHAWFLASTGHVDHACSEYRAAEELMKSIPQSRNVGYSAHYIALCAESERLALANTALAAIKMAETDVSSAIASLNAAYRLWCRAASGISRIAIKMDPAAKDSAPPSPLRADGITPPGSTSQKPKNGFYLEGKRLGGLQWYYAMGLFDSTLDLIAALAQRGTVKECEYYLNSLKQMVPSIRSTALEARVSAQDAALDARKFKYESSAASLRHAAEVLAVRDGPDAIELKRLRGELYSRQQAAPQADEFFTIAIEALASLNEDFAAVESHASPKKDPKAVVKEPLLPHALGHILRQRAWLLREAGEMEEYEHVMQQLELVPEAAGEKPEQLFLDARVAMSEAFNHFKTDLFMSSLTESTIAMTMAAPDKRKDRLSTRNGANVLLERAVEAFRTTLATDARTGRVEDVRQACVSLAVLGAFQTSLGQGSPAITSMAAGVLASVSSLTLDRELIPAIESKFPDPAMNDLTWPALERAEINGSDPAAAYWNEVAAKRNAASILDRQYDLKSLPYSWAIVSITVTDDRNTMLVSRHQNGFDPVVFCIPLDRQGRREGEDESELFTFDAGINELEAIMEGNDASIKSISACVTMEDRKSWWNTRYALDARLGELLASIEFCWLGAFKTILNPRPIINAEAFTAFRERLDLIFQGALSSAGTDTRRGARVRLNDALLACFATLSSKCKDEEIEDLVYFVLDQYQFHGIAVALAELDFEQIGVDVKAALADLEIATAGTREQESKEHLLLVLDKNVQGIPWESLPILLGRAVSRIPSLSFLLDQVALGNHLGIKPDGRSIDASKTAYFMNPGGDLTGTEGRFRDRLTALHDRGWTGISGTKPTEAQMQDALRDRELVMYFGHGGGEEYIRGYKVRALPRCAVTMLWGCSSGKLRDHGNFDRTGTPYDYALAGAPCLVANLWDVTDKDIDLVTAEVMDLLGLAASTDKQGRAMSIVQAVANSRHTAKLQYLTGAATVVYGVPVWIR